MLLEKKSSAPRNDKKGKTPFFSPIPPIKKNNNGDNTVKLNAEPQESEQAPLTDSVPAPENGQRIGEQQNPPDDFSENADHRKSNAKLPDKTEQEKENIISKEEPNNIAQKQKSENQQPKPSTSKTAKNAHTAQKNTESQTPSESKPAAQSGGGGGASTNATSDADASPEPIDSSNSLSVISSWTGQSPVSFIQNANNVSGPLTAAQENEKNELEESLPEIEQPTGIPGKAEKKPSTKKEGDLGKEEIPDLSPEGGKSEIPAPEPVPLPNTPVNNTPIPAGVDVAGGSAEDEGSWWSRIFNKIRSFLGGLQTRDDSVDTTAGTPPKVPLEGESDPSQNETHAQESKETITAEKTNADQTTTQDFGENDIYPEVEPEMMSPEIELGEPPEAPSSQSGEIGDISPEVIGPFNEQAKPKMDELVAEEMAKAEEERGQFDMKSLEERQATDEKIAEETEKTKEEQEKIQDNSKTEVEGLRSQWKEENIKIKQEYEDQSEVKKREIDGEINEKIASTDAEVTQKYESAEQEAADKKREAEQEAERKKREEQNKPKSTWQRIKGGISSAFNAIKGAINKIFDGLRAFVKKVIEAAKKAAFALIDLARKAIVGLIKAFGEALKALVSIALAAFPEIAEKFNNWIDKAVDAATDLVNKLADALKAAVAALLDLLGAALDALLSLYQKFINLIIDVLHFITVGLMEILEGIANLVEAATEMPGNFWGQVSEEMLGVDVTKPLPNEIPMPSPHEEEPTTVLESESDQLFAQQLMDKSELGPEDVETSEVAHGFELDEELMDQISLMSDEGILEFETPEEGGPEQVDEIKRAALADLPETDKDVGSEIVPETPQQTPANNQVEAIGEEVTEAGMVGPFSGAGERLAYLAGQMKEGILKWWNENKVAIIAGLILGITGVILANVLTGGAILAALPLLMQIVGALFLGAALAKATGYFGTYLGQAFPGNIGAGAVALARASAIIVVELVTSLLFAGKGVVKGAKAAVKTIAKQGVKGGLKAGVKATKTAGVKAIKETGKAVKELGKVSAGGFKAGIKNGKLVLGGIGKGIGKGAKSFKGLAKRIAGKLKLRKIKIERKKTRFFVFGEFNPWVLLATGEVKKVKNKGGKKVGQEGKFVTEKGGEVVEGVLVGGTRKSSEFVKHLKNNDELATFINNARLNPGKLDPENLVKGLSRTPADKIDDVFRGIDNLKHVDGIDVVLKDLAGGGYKPLGAQWVLEFTGKNPNFAKSVTKLEAKVKDLGRVYDVKTGNAFYEFKNWTSFVEPSFIKQIAKDIEGGKNFKWIFSPKLGKTHEEITKIIRGIIKDEKKLLKYLDEKTARSITTNESVQQKIINSIVDLDKIS